MRMYFPRIKSANVFHNTTVKNSTADPETPDAGAGERASELWVRAPPRPPVCVLLYWREWARGSEPRPWIVPDLPLVLGCENCFKVLVRPVQNKSQAAAGALMLEQGARHAPAAFVVSSQLPRTGSTLPRRIPFDIRRERGWSLWIVKREGGQFL